jgi:4-coumarate--CoA ligase
MSESGFALMVPAGETIPSLETVGQVVPGFTLKVIDGNGNALEANHVGEICVKGDQVTTGYYGAEKETQRLFTSDGFLRSGDLGFYDEKEFFFVVGRIKDMIKCDGLYSLFEFGASHSLSRAGVSVSPAELENLLLSHKEVTCAAVIGVEDDERGHVPMAFVTLVEGAESSEEQLSDWLDRRVNEFKKLRGGLRVIQSMPRTHSGKVRKSLLHEIFIE